MTFHNSTMCGNDNRNITFGEINELLKDWTGVIIDVRTRKEVKETGSLPHSINIPINELEAALLSTPEDFERKYHHALPDRNTKIIFTCCTGRRSATALRVALGLGFINPYNYAGGWRDWEAHILGQKVANQSEFD